MNNNEFIDIFLSYLKPVSDNWNIDLSEEKINTFIEFYNILIRKNETLNLTSIVEFEDVIIKHYIDSLAILQLSDLLPINDPLQVLDVGTGAGFPGIPLKIFNPEYNVTCLDSTEKKVNFINETVSILGLNNIVGIHGRAEELAHASYRNYYDLVVSRAVASFNVLCELCITFVKINGFFVAYKSGHVEEELTISSESLSLLGGKIEKVHFFNLPDKEQSSRSLIIIKKIKETSNKYPRKFGIIKKKPL